LPADSEFSNLNIGVINEFEIERTAFAVEREILRSLGVTQHNEADSIYVLETLQSVYQSVPQQAFLHGYYAVVRYSAA